MGTARGIAGSTVADGAESSRADQETIEASPLERGAEYVKRIARRKLAQAVRILLVHSSGCGRASGGGDAVRVFESLRMASAGTGIIGGRGRALPDGC